MACLLRLTQPGALERFLDPSGDDYVPAIVGGPLPVTCMIYPYLPAQTALANTAAVLVNGVAIASVPAQQGAAAQVQFTIGNNPSESAPNWNSINVTIQDDFGGLTSFTFYFYKSNGPGGGGGTTTAQPATTLNPITTLPPLAAAARPAAPAKRSARKKS